MVLWGGSFMSLRKREIRFLCDVTKCPIYIAYYLKQEHQPIMADIEGGPFFDFSLYKQSHLFGVFKINKI